MIFKRIKISELPEVPITKGLQSVCNDGQGKTSRVSLDLLADVPTLSTKATKAEKSIESLSTKVEDTGKNIESLSTKAANAEKDINSLSTKIANTEKNFESLSEKVRETAATAKAYTDKMKGEVIKDLSVFVTETEINEFANSLN